MRSLKWIIITGIVFLCGGYFMASLYGAQQAAKFVEQMQSALGDVVHIQYQKLSYQPITQKITLKKVKIVSAKEDEWLAKMKEVSFKVKKNSQEVITEVKGHIVKGQLAQMSPEKYTIGYRYVYSPSTKDAAIQLECESARQKYMMMNLKLGQVNPDMDLLFDYPSVQVQHAFFEFQGRAWTQAVLSLLGATDLVTETLSLTFDPAQPIPMAQVIDSFPHHLGAHQDFKIKAGSETFSLTEWIENYGTRFKEKLSVKNTH